MSEKHRKVCTAVSGCVSVSAFASLVGIPVGITSSAVGVTAVQVNN